MNSSKRDIRAAETAERRSRALVLRKAGATYEQISQQLGLSGKSGARTLVHDAIRDLTREHAAEVVVLELSRLDQMLFGCWSKAVAGDPQSIDRALRIMERRSAYLGIDAPKKVATVLDANITITDGAHEELLARLAALTATAEGGIGR